MNLLNFASKKGGICFYRNSHSAVNTSACIQILLSVAQQPNLGQGQKPNPVGVGAEVATYTTHYKHDDETSIPSVEFEPAISAINRSQTYSLDDTATAICLCKYCDHFSNNVTIFLWERDAFPKKFISQNFIIHLHKVLPYYICALFWHIYSKIIKTSFIYTREYFSDISIQQSLSRTDSMEGHLVQTTRQSEPTTEQSML
jgi:hypothetical protein